MILFVGRLVPEKGCEYLIRAMAEIQGFAPEAKLVVIGDGPLRASWNCKPPGLSETLNFSVCNPRR